MDRPAGHLSELGVALQDWEFATADTRCLTHDVHRYSGKFIPQIAGRAIELLTAPGELILDPYCGSGTALLEAAIRGRRSAGVDINPLAVLISRVKTTHVGRCQLTRLRDRLATELLCASGDQSLFQVESAMERIRLDPRWSDAWFTKWFQPGVLGDLIAIYQAVANVEDSQQRDIALVAFSDILRKVSNAHSGYPNVMFDKHAIEKPATIGRFLASLEVICSKVDKLSGVEHGWMSPSVSQGDATRLVACDNSVDAVITHPPYVGSVPYAEYGVLSLKWLGFDPRELDRNLTGGRRQSADVVTRFKHSYGMMISEACRVLKPGRHLFVMVGNPLVKGQLVDLRAMTVELAGCVGFELVAAAERAGVNRRANKMGSEFLLFFEKGC